MSRGRLLRLALVPALVGLATLGMLWRGPADPDGAGSAPPDAAQPAAGTMTQEDASAAGRDVEIPTPRKTDERRGDQPRAAPTKAPASRPTPPVEPREASGPAMFAGESAQRPGTEAACRFA
jgi:hypothetical protein